MVALSGPRHFCDLCKIAHAACLACGGLVDGAYDAHRATHHYCDAAGSTAPPEDRVYTDQQPLEGMLRELPETWDTCNSCQGVWIRFGKGPRLDPRTHRPHTCPQPEQRKPPSVPESSGYSFPQPTRPAAKLKIL